MCVKIESYCGIECSSCELKQSNCCGTCVKTKGVTFYKKDGTVCPVAQCAISKNRRFCGECAEFPCELLTRFAFDKEHGDNGKRIEQCKIWKAALVTDARKGTDPISVCGHHCDLCFFAQWCGANSVWGDYGTNKILCEKYYSSVFPNTYIIRPPYLYGQGNNVYREAFAFDCADFNRTFYLPENGKMKMQFFHIDDLCRFIHILLEQKPEQRIFNVGNAQSISVKEWVNLCYAAAGQTPAFKFVDTSVPQRNYFCFHKYEYALDVSRMSALMPETISLSAGLNKSYDWYKAHKDEVNRRDYFNYIDNDLKISEKSNVKA